MMLIVNRLRRKGSNSKEQDMKLKQQKGWQILIGSRFCNKEDQERLMSSFKIKFYGSTKRWLICKRNCWKKRWTSSKKEPIARNQRSTGYQFKSLAKCLLRKNCPSDSKTKPMSKTGLTDKSPNTEIRSRTTWALGQASWIMLHNRLAISIPFTRILKEGSPIEMKGKASWRPRKKLVMCKLARILIWCCTRGLIKNLQELSKTWIFWQMKLNLPMYSSTRSWCHNSSLFLASLARLF